MTRATPNTLLQIESLESNGFELRSPLLTASPDFSLCEVWDAAQAKSFLAKSPHPRPRGPLGDETRERYAVEAETLTALSHPNIPRLVCGLVTEAGVPWLLLDQADGTDFRTWTASRRRSTVDVLAVLRDVALALQHAHQQQPPVFHRDVKATNVLVDVDGRGKLVNFELSTRLDAYREPPGNAMVGTLQYQPPEYVEAALVRGGRPQHTVHTELWAFGCLIYDAFAQRPPFRGDTLEELLRDILRARYTPLSDVRDDLPPALDALVRELLSPDPGGRPHSARSVADRLSVLLEEQLLR